MQCESQERIATQKEATKVQLAKEAQESAREDQDSKERIEVARMRFDDEQE